MKLKTLLILVLLVGGLAGCASTFMEQYLNKDVREIAIDNGPPFNAFDMGDGRRVFQWHWGGGSIVVPQTTTVSGSATAIGNKTWYSGTAITSGGGVISSEGCILSYFAKWNSESESWVVTEYRVPRQLVC